MKINPEVFVDAADILQRYHENNQYAMLGLCWAVQSALLNHARYGEWDDYRKFMADYFKPSSRSYGDYWFGEPHFQRNKDRRINALFMLVELAKDQQ